MAYRKFTQCYNYLATGEKPFHIDDLVSIVAGAAGPGGVAALILFASGAFAIGAIALAIGFVSAIATVADLWLFHRLVCLTGIKCAVGIVNDRPHHGGLGNFDNDDSSTSYCYRIERTTKSDRRELQFNKLIQRITFTRTT